MVEIYADVAKFQPLLDSTYPRKFVMFRLVNEFGNIDPHAAANIATAVAMRKQGKLVNFGGYVNPGHIANSTVLAKIRELDFPTDAQIMLDVEQWPDKDTGVPLISGDHSAGLTALADAVRTRQQGRADLVTAYGNRHDLLALFTTRPSWLGLVIAGYNTNDPSDEYPNLFAWQYTNGIENHTAWPSASSPFGHCDHNRLYVPIPPTEEDMPTAQEIAEAVRDVSVVNDATKVAMTLGDRLVGAQAQTGLNAKVADLAAGQAAIVNALAQLGTGGGAIDYDRVRQAAQTAAEAALANTHLAVG